MLHEIKKLLGMAGDDESAAGRFDEEQLQLAAAALLVHASRIDGEVAAQENDQLARLLKAHFDLTESDLNELLTEADRAEREAVDLYRFTRVLCRHLDQNGRKSIVEMLWRMAFADGILHEFEDNLVWRVAELLGVSTRDRMILKQKIKAEQTGRSSNMVQDKGD